VTPGGDTPSSFLPRERVFGAGRLPAPSVSLPTLPSSHSHTAFRRSAVQLLLSPGDARSYHCIGPSRHLRTVRPGVCNHRDAVYRQPCAAIQCSSGGDQQGRTGSSCAADRDAGDATLCPGSLNA
jgi:hypothetical protein